MLDFFRRQRSNFKWVWIILIFIFTVTLVTLYIPITDMGTIRFSTDVAEVGGETVTAREFESAYRNYLNQMGTQMTPEMLRAFGFETQIINALVDQYVMIGEAKRLGLDVSAAEIQLMILENPVFREGEAFIGLTRYRDILAQNGLTVAEFESSVRNQLLMTKLFSLLTAAATVSDDEVEAEYRRRNEKVQLEYFVVDGPSVEDKVELTVADLRQYHEANASRYTIPEMRRSRYVFVSTNQIQARTEVTDEALRAYYAQRQEDYRLPPRVSAQHILFRTEGKTPEEIEAIRDRALMVLAEARGGADFGQLAMEYSEDTSAAAGGDLGSFGPGQMVPEFERAAFSLGEGAISDLVQSQFGFHIIKVNEKQEERLRPFEEVRAGIESIVRFQQASSEAAETAQAIAVDLVNDGDLDAVAARYGAEVRETPLAAQGEAFVGLTDTAALENQVFSMSLSEIGTSVAVGNGYVIPSVVEIQEAHPASFEEASEQVEADLRTERARDLAIETAAQVERLLGEGQSLAQAAAAVGIEVETSDLLAHDGFIESFGATSALDGQIFNLEVGMTGEPVTVAGKTIAFRVVERQEVDPQSMEAGFADLRAELLQEKKNLLFDAYGRQARRRMESEGEIEVDTELVQEIAQTLII